MGRAVAQFQEPTAEGRSDGATSLDLTHLRQIHPLLPASTAAEYAHRAALGLERHHHSPGVRLSANGDLGRIRAYSLHWSAEVAHDSDQLDYHRITEDAAESVSLALVHAAMGWVVRRRLQRGEFADWLLVDPNEKRVALEVSGLDNPDGGRRLREKREQVRRATVAGRKAVCVVVLATPHATLASV